VNADHFAAALSALGVPDGAPIGVAVSGGPDSLALLWLAVEALRGRVFAATVDHGLRPEARAEAEHVAAICASMAVPHDILDVRVEGSVQAGAREARYRALEAWCTRRGLAWLATAHHADDQAETLLMRLSRGAGLSGLAGVRRSRALGQVRLVRPLLEWRKDELVALAARLEPLQDPSNSDPAYDRTRARALLETAPWLDPLRMAGSAEHLAEAEEALDWMVDRLTAERVDGDTLDPADLPPELLRRLLLRQFARLGEAPRGPELTRLIGALHQGRAGTLGRVKVSPGARWTFSRTPPRRGDQ
jgi:tRNA(Ile)-lysidine synthase